MNFKAFVFDYDNTLARHGSISSSTVDHLNRLKAQGLKLVLVTGRETEDLKTICPYLSLFSWVVAENGGVIFSSDHTEPELLTEAPKASFLDALTKNGIPFSRGYTIVSTEEPYQNGILSCIKDLGLESQLIFNKGSVMILPTGINKASGLIQVLKRMGLSPLNVIAFGDGENDHSLLEVAGLGVAVGDAVASLRERADIVTTQVGPEGIEETIAAFLDGDPKFQTLQAKRHPIKLDSENSDIEILTSDGDLAIVALPGEERMRCLQALTLGLTKAHYQWCVLNFGDQIPALEGGAVLGSDLTSTDSLEIVSTLKHPGRGLILNLGLKGNAPDKSVLDSALKAVGEVVKTYGRPHYFIVCDYNRDFEACKSTLKAFCEKDSIRFVLVTAAGSAFMQSSLTQRFGVVMGSGAVGKELIQEWCSQREGMAQSNPASVAITDEILVCKGGVIRTFRSRLANPETREPSPAPKKPISLPLEGTQQFCFTGPEDKLSLCARSVQTFIDIGQGIDDDTWMYHLHKAHYSKWFRDVLGLKDIATEIEQVERNKTFAPKETKEAISKVIAEHFV